MPPHGPSGKPTVTGTTALDNVIYAAFRSALPAYNVAVTPHADELHQHEQRAWQRLLRLMIKRGIQAPPAPALLARDALIGYTPQNTVLVCRAVALVIEIARRREIEGHLPCDVDKW